MKPCSRCKKVQPLTEFGPNKQTKDRLQSWCKTCCREKNRQWQREWRANHPEYFRQMIWQREYGLDRAEVEELLVKQRHRCAICEVRFVMDGRHQGFYIDHDHKTDEVRGLLCQRCNHGLGQFCDNPKWLRKAAKYLRDVRIPIDKAYKHPLMLFAVK